jgi:hypothetical protein
MLTLYIDEKTSEGKSLLKYAIKLNAPSKPIRIKRRVLSDEEMALPGVTPTAKELEEWITEPAGKGSSVEVARKRLLKKFHKEFSGAN